MILEESERRLKDIRRMEEEGLITNNDVLRSEMQLTENRLSLRETENNIRLVSQQLEYRAVIELLAVVALQIPSPHERG